MSECRSFIINKRVLKFGWAFFFILFISIETFAANVEQMIDDILSAATAHEVLGLSSGQWEMRDATTRRNDLLRLLHPDKLLESLSEDKRRQALEAAQLVNAAYDALKGKGRFKPGSLYERSRGSAYQTSTPPEARPRGATQSESRENSNRNREGSDTSGSQYDWRALARRRLAKTNIPSELQEEIFNSLTNTHQFEVLARILGSLKDNGSLVYSYVSRLRLVDSAESRREFANHFWDTIESRKEALAYLVSRVGRDEFFPVGLEYIQTPKAVNGLRFLVEMFPLGPGDDIKAWSASIKWPAHFLNSVRDLSDLPSYAYYRLQERSPEERSQGEKDWELLKFYRLLALAIQDKIRRIPSGSEVPDNLRHAVTVLFSVMERRMNTSVPLDYLDDDSSFLVEMAKVVRELLTKTTEPQAEQTRVQLVEYAKRRILNQPESFYSFELARQVLSPAEIILIFRDVRNYNKLIDGLNSKYAWSRTRGLHYFQKAIEEALNEVAKDLESGRLALDVANQIEEALPRFLLEESRTNTDLRPVVRKFRETLETRRNRSRQCHAVFG